jgi:hypothetical protein
MEDKDPLVSTVNILYHEVNTSGCLKKSGQFQTGGYITNLSPTSLKLQLNDRIGNFILSCENVQHIFS